MTDNIAVSSILEALASAKEQNEARQLHLAPEAGSLERPIDFVAAIPATLPAHFYDMTIAPPAGLTVCDRASFGSRFPNFFVQMLGEGGLQKVLGAIEDVHPTAPKYLYSASTLYACTKDLVVMIVEATTIPPQGALS